MKTLITGLFFLTAFGCSSDRTPDYLENDEMERQEEVIQNEEDSRTGKSDEMGPGYDYGTSSSPN